MPETLSTSPILNQQEQASNSGQVYPQESLPPIEKPKKTWLILIFLAVILILVGGVLLVTFRFFAKTKEEPSKKIPSQIQTRTYFNSKYNFSFSYPAEYALIEKAGQPILGATDALVLSFENQKPQDLADKATVAVFYFPKEEGLDDFILRLTQNFPTVSARVCPRRVDCKILPDSEAANFPLQIVLKGKRNIIGIQIKDGQGKFVNFTNLPKVVLTAFTTLQLAPD